MLSTARSLRLLCALTLLLAPTSAAAMSFTLDAGGGGLGPVEFLSSGNMGQPVDGVVTWVVNPDFDQALFEDDPSTPGEVDPGTVAGQPLFLFDDALDPIRTTGQGAIASVNFWEAQLKMDPFVTNNFSVTNELGVTQAFTVTVTLPLNPAFLYNQVVRSSVGFSLTDTNANNMMDLGLQGINPFYQGRVDTNEYQLPLTPGSLPADENDCGPAFPGCTFSDSLNQAPDPINVPQNLADEIEIILRFTLSPGDSVSVTSRFEIVPEPTTALLFGFGLAGIAVANRRRR